MAKPEMDHRSHERRILDEQIAAELPLAAPDLPLNANPKPLEAHLGPRRRPMALAGVVENGLVRPLDPTIKLAERSRVIIVASE